MAWVECPNAPAAVAQVLNRDVELPILRLGHHHIVEDGVPVPERGERAYVIPLPERLQDRLEQARRLAGGLDLGPVAVRIPEEAATDSGPENLDHGSTGSGSEDSENQSMEESQSKRQRCESPNNK
jgi:hypothetical protein